MIDTAAEPFQYGRLDCALWVARYVDRVCGTDYAAGWRYNAENFETVLSELNGLANIVTERLGHPLQIMADARTGDVALVNLSGGTLGICCPHGALIKTKTSATVAPARLILQAWRVPYADR